MQHLRALCVGVVVGVVLSRPAFAGSIPIQSDRCGISYLVPSGWSATPSANEGADGLVIACRFELKPSKWEKLDADSKWGAGEPITVAVYAPGTSFKSACEHIYDRDDEGELGIAGRFSFGVVQRYRRGNFRGFVAYGNFRGFAKEGAVSEEDGRIYTGGNVNIVVASSSGRVVSVYHACGSPDVTVDCDSAITLFLHSLVFRTPTPAPPN